MIGFVREVDENKWESTPVTHTMTMPAIEGSHKHIWDMTIRSAALIPKYMKEAGYKSPASVSDGPLQYAHQTKLASFEFWSSKPDTLEDFNNMMTGVRHSRPSWIEWFPVRDRLLKDYREDTVLLVDVGGGWGHDLVAFQKKHAVKERLALQDLPHVIAGVHDLPPNVEAMDYDFFEKDQIIKGTAPVVEGKSCKS